MRDAAEEAQKNGRFPKDISEAVPVLEERPAYMRPSVALRAYLSRRSLRLDRESTQKAFDAIDGKCK